MKEITKSRLFLAISIILLLIIIGNNTNWFGLKKTNSLSSSTKRITEAYADLTQDQMLELDKFRTALAKA